jgi:ABC-type multidrug transport system fused ATPase/permease subunit
MGALQMNKLPVRIARESFELVRPFGSWKLAFVVISAIVSGALQMIGLAAVFPFLALAADPEGARGRWPFELVISRWPELTHRDLVLMSGTVCILMIVVSNLAAWLYGVIQSHYTSAVGTWLRARLARSFFERPMIYLHRVNSAVLVKKTAYDVYVFTVFVLFSLLEVISRSLLVLLVVALLASVAGVGVTALVGAGLTLLYLGSFAIAGRHRAEVAEALGEASRNLNVVSQQIVQGMRELRMRDCGDHFLKRLDCVSESQARAMRTSSILTATPRAVIEAILFIALIGWVMFLAARDGSFQEYIPLLGLIAVASLRLLPNLHMIYSYVNIATSNVHALDEIREELIGESAKSRNTAITSQRSPVPKMGKEIRLENIVFSYPGSFAPTIQGVSLSIKANSSVAFIGATGSGKSTLLNIIAGLYEPTGGRLLVDGSEIIFPACSSWFTQIGYVPQDVYLFDGTLAENIALGIPEDEVDRERIREVCRMAQIQDFVERDLPGGYDAEVGERGVRLSGGQRQRIALARALYRGPRILMLDEATSALDTKTEERFMNIVYNLSGTLTILMVAHRLSTVRQCNEIFILKNGRLSGSVASNQLEKVDDSFFTSPSS